MIIGTAGHIDHGKTALVRALTGVDTDRLPEEKRRGITIELGFAPLELPGLGTVGVVDVPGHEAFVRTMVAGATGIDLGLLVVAADEGVMPQTREHLTILSLLAVQSGVLVLTKCDLADPDWIALVREDLRDLVRSTPLASAAIIETSARDGRGIAELKTEIAARLSDVSARGEDDLFRLPVDRAFSVKGTGTVVTGTSWSGRVTSASEVRLFPIDRLVRVRALQSHGHAVEQAGPGARLAMALAGVEVGDVPRGSVLVGAGPWQASNRFHADVVLDAGAAPFRPREWLRLLVGTSEVSARVVPVPGLGGAVVRVVAEVPLVLRAGDRFILRRSQPLSTIGGGRVLDPSPVRRKGRPTQGWSDDPGTRLAEAVRLAGAIGLDEHAVPIRVGCDFSTSRALGATHPEIERITGRIYLTSLVAGVEEAVVKEVLTYHDLNPIDEGVPPARLRARLAEFGDLVDHGIDRLATLGRLEVVSGLVRKAGHRPRVSQGALAEKDWLLSRLESAGMEPPSVSELKVERGHDVLPMLRLLEKEGLVVPVEADRYYGGVALAKGLETLAQRMRGGGVFAPGQLREAVGVSRKFLMPLLEYCDRRRITERRGDGRVWLDGPGR